MRYQCSRIFLFVSSILKRCLFALPVAFPSICIMARKQYCHLVGVQNVTFSAPPPDLSTCLSLIFQQMNSAGHSVLTTICILGSYFMCAWLTFGKQFQRNCLRFLGNASHQSCDVGAQISTLLVREPRLAIKLLRMS